MPHTTANGTATPAAVAQSAAAASLTAAHQDRLLRTAERIVKSLAPPPEVGLDNAYKVAAADTEVQVFRYLVSTDENTLSSESLSGVDSSSYRSYKEAVAPIVADSMADWYVGLDAKADSSDVGVARVGYLRRRR